MSDTATAASKPPADSRPAASKPSAHPSKAPAASKPKADSKAPAASKPPADSKAPAASTPEADSAAAAAKTATTKWKEGGPVLVPGAEKDGAVAYLRGVVKKVTATDKGENLQVEIEGETGKTVTSNATQCLPTNTKEDIDECRDLCELPVSSEKAIIDALRYSYMDKTDMNIYANIRNVLVAVNPSRDNGQTRVQVAGMYKSGRLTPEELEKPHIFSLCTKVQQMSDITGASACVVLRGESGSGKTETARHIVRFFTTPMPQVLETSARNRSVCTALESAAPILQAFGNAKTMHNENSSRFGLHCQMYMEGGDVVAGRLSHFLLETSRVANRGLHTTFNFNVFYDIFHGLRRSVMEELAIKKVKDYKCLAGDAGSLGQGGRGKASFTEELLPALESIGVNHKMQKDLWSCLGGILGCSNVEWVEGTLPGSDFRELPASTCTKPQELREVARLLGVPDEELHDSLCTVDRQVKSVKTRSPVPPANATDRTMNLATGLYSEIFSWLVRRLNTQLGAPDSNSKEPRWIGVLDMFGFENMIGKTQANSIEQLLINLADEYISEWFLAKFVDLEGQALKVKAFEEDQADQILKEAEANAAKSRAVMDLVTGTSKVEGILNILEKSCDEGDDERADAAFTDTCSATLSKSYDKVFMASPSQKKSFVITHSFGSAEVEYATSGFAQKSRAALEDSAIQLLSKSTNIVISEIFSFDGIDREDRLKGNRRFIDQLDELSKQLRGSGSVETQFVACVRPNKELQGKEGYFDWLSVEQDLESLGILSMARLQRSAVRFPCRQRHAEFLQEFSALCISTSARPQKSAKGAVKTILTTEIETYKQDSKVNDDVVMVTKECAIKLRTKMKAKQEELTSLATTIQQAARASKTNESFNAARINLLKLQACARRRLELGDSVDDKAARRKEAVVTVQAHLRTALQRDAYSRMVEANEMQGFIGTLAGLCKALQFAKACQDVLSIRQSADEVAAPFLTCALRLKLTRRRIEDSALAMQNLRRGKMAQETVAAKSEDRDAAVLLSNVAESVALRTRLARIITEKKTLVLQAQVRSVQSKRQADDIRAEKKEFEALSGALQTVCARWQFERYRTAVAAQALQANRRKLEDVRKTDEIRANKEAWKVLSSAVMTLMYRQAMVTKGTSDVAARLQAQRRAVVDRRRVDTIRTEQDLWSSIKGWSSTFLLRVQLDYAVTEQAARTLQRMWRLQMARRSMHQLRFIRLQQLVGGVWQRRQAQELMIRLKQEDILKQNVLLVVSAMEAVQLRRQHVAYREQMGALQITKSVRGMRARKQVSHLRIIWAQRQFHGVYRMFQARYSLATALNTHETRLASELMQAHFQTLRLRGHFHMFKRHVQATSTLQRFARGLLARKQYRTLGWQTRATRGQTTIAALWQRYKAQGVLLEVQGNDRVERAQETLWSVMRTLVARRDHETYYQELRLGRAATLIQQFWRGWWWRQHPDVAKVITSIGLIRRELEDAQLQKRHAGAALVQGAWRSWLVRQVRLLPVMISTLAMQRRSVLQARVKETGGLKGFRSSPDGTGPSWMTEHGGGQVVNLSLPVEDNSCFSGWVDVLLALEHRGETILDMSVGVEHAVVVCTSGRIFVYNDPGTFHDYEGEFREEEFQLSPIMFREPVRVEPTIIAVACGERHSLFLSDQGVVWAWGWNERGQCGVGRHLPLECYLKMTCLQQWAKKPNPASANVQTPGEDLPRCTSIACGARHSGVVDAEGAMWIWGEHQGVGLYRVRSTKVGQSPAFLLFKFSRGGKDAIQPIEATNDKPLLTDFQRYLEEQIDQLAPSRADDNKSDEPSEQLSIDSDIATKFSTTSKVFKGMENKTGSLRRMLTDAQKYVCIKEATGDILSPSKCCNLVMSLQTEAARLRAAGTPVIDSFIPGWCCPVFPAPARGVRFSSVNFGGDLNAALTEKGYLYTWGKSEIGMLGRKADVPGKPSVPVRVPLFPQLAISIISLSVGYEHVVALTSHGRVFIWGRVEACMGPEGFCRNTLMEPMFVEGVLRELRIVKVAAGRLESVVTTENFDVLLGFEMLELSNVGHRLLPVCYQYTLTGPKTGYADASFSRLKVIQSQAVQLLYVGGATSEYQSHLDPTPDPEGPKIRKGHNFMRKGMGSSRLTNPHGLQNSSGKRARGLATQELFQWSSRSVLSRTPTYTEPVQKVAHSKKVAPSHGRRQRDYLEQDKDLHGYRRLAMSRHDSDILGLDPRHWKIEGYEIQDPQFLDSEVDELSEDPGDDYLALADI